MLATEIGFFTQPQNQKNPAELKEKMTDVFHKNMCVSLLINLAHTHPPPK